MSQKTPRSILLGVALSGMAGIVLEITLTRIFSVTLWYHFAYLVVSLALFGLGAGGLIAFFLQSFFDRTFPRILGKLALGQALSTLLCIILVLQFGQQPSLTFTYITGLLALYILCAVPFLFLGLIFALAFHHFASDTPRVYFWDLLGSATGCLVFAVAISYISGPMVVALSAILAFAAACAYAGSSGTRSAAIHLALLVAFAGGIAGLHKKSDLFRVKHTKAYEERGDILFEKWSPLARITVYPKVFWGDPNDAFGWGMSKAYKQQKGKQEQLWVEQDASAGTPITKYNGDPASLDFLTFDITAFGYHVQPETSNVFVIGCGGGRDILTGLAFDVPAVHGCDINPVTVGLVRDTFSEFAGDVYNLPGVHVEVAEGRNYIRRSEQPFDLIQIPLIDSWAATAAGAFSLSENSLYTVEAFLDYADRLTDRGMLSITRYLFQPRNQSLRVAVVAREALDRMGVEDPSQHLAVIATEEGNGKATVLMKRTPFTDEEIGLMEQAAADLQFVILYHPRTGGDESFEQAMKSDSLDDFVASSYYDIRPVTDDRPFFFQMVYFSRAFDLVFGKAVTGQVFNYYAPLILLVLLALSGVLVAIFYFLPLLASRKVERLPSIWGVYFVCLGLGFMFVEIPLLQRGSLYLGHPTYSLTIVLLSMLVFAGLGSFWSGTIPTEKLPSRLPKLILVATVLVWVATWLTEYLTQTTIGLPLVGRIMLFIAPVGIVAFFMGVAFPSGVRLISGEHDNAVPWVWALNGGASVMGSGLAMAFAMGLGYSATLVLGGLIYLGAFVVLLRATAGARASGVA